MFTYATKSNFKNAIGVVKSQFAKKDDLGNIKSRVDKLDIDKLEKVLNSLNSLKITVDELDIGKLSNKKKLEVE